MTAKIIHFPIERTKDDINNEFIEVLEKLKDQKVSGYFVLASIENEDFEWMGHYNWLGNNYKWQVIGGIEALKSHLIKNHCFKEMEDEDD
jgi:hypothetical protein